MTGNMESTLPISPEGTAGFRISRQDNSSNPQKSMGTISKERENSSEDEETSLLLLDEQGRREGFL